MKKKPMSLRTVLILSLIGTVTLVISCTIFLFVQTYQRLLIDNTETASRQSVSQVAHTVEAYLEEVDSVMDVLEEELEKPEQREEFFQNLLRIRPDIAAVTTYDGEGRLMDCQSLTKKNRAQADCNLSFSLERAREKKHYISDPHVLTLFEGYYPWVVSVVVPVDTDSGERWVSADIRFRDLADYINDVGIGRHGYCFLMNPEGDIVYHPQQQLLYSDLKEENTGLISGLSDGAHLEKNVICTVRTINGQGLKVVGVSFVDEMITEGVANIARLLTVTGSAMILMSLLLSLVVTRLLTRPISRLTKAMGDFERDASRFTYTPATGIREIRLLSGSFSHMVTKIQQLMETVRQEQINLRKTELRALQAQINPHFLYNTLDSIAWMCERGKTGEAVEMVNALARLFRISISRGHELIPIRSELQHAESYLKIQAYRYRDQFSYEFQVEEGIDSFLCNKITLQPIIENAIYHGINGLVDEGRITICARSEGENILFVVEDNGNGMEPEQVAAILQKERSDRAGIGIKNVNDRLKIYFGPEYGITIHSVPDEGTRVEIRMPRVTEEADYENR